VRELIVSVPDEGLLEALGPQPSDVKVVLWDFSQPAPRTSIDIVVVPYLGPADRFRRLEEVRTSLVQSQSIGFDGLETYLPEGTTFANAASVHETSTAELTLALILASQRGIPDFVRQAEAGHWHRAWYPSLADRTVLLVGYGGVGRAVEERLLPFETTVERVARTERRDDHGVVHAFSALPSLLSRSDIVVVAVPLSETTTHLIDDAFLAAIPDGSLLVNVSRGTVADTEALIAHARSGRIRLALDVTDPEPLPDGHPLFTMPNVLISPHVGGATNAMLARMARLVNRQIERMRCGEPPLNVVIGEGAGQSGGRSNAT
jgi:phosphoglycerate dehydrogenase-like enzyme